MADEEKQVILSVGREFGSAGHLIAEKVASRLGYPLYDYSLLRELAAKNDLDVKELEQYDEIPKCSFLTRSVLGNEIVHQQNTAMMQFEFIRKLAAEGKSFVVVGRCSEEVLKDFDCMIPIFIMGDMDYKIKRIAQVYKMSEDQAYETILSQDKKRKEYHNYYCKGKWGDSRNYEMCINSSKIGIDATVDLIIKYIENRNI